MKVKPKKGNRLRISTALYGFTFRARSHEKTTNRGRKRGKAKASGVRKGLERFIQRPWGRGRKKEKRHIAFRTTFLQRFGDYCNLPK